MKRAMKITMTSVSVLVMTIVGTGVVMAATTPLPSEQQALIDAGYTKAETWAKFDKQMGSCHIQVQASGKNYYVFTTGKLNSTLYPVIPKQLMAGVTLMNANCQG